MIVMLQMHVSIMHGRPQGGGARVGRRHPPWKIKNKFLGYFGDLFATFSLYGGLFATIFSLRGAFSPCGGLYATFYSMVGAFFGLAPPPPPPPRKFLRAPIVSCSIIHVVYVIDHITHIMTVPPVSW